MLPLLSACPSGGAEDGLTTVDDTTGDGDGDGDSSSDEIGDTGDSSTDSDTTDADTTDADTTDATTGDPVCGDGMVDAGEECDQGPDNSDTGACKSDCTLQVCGDGYVGPREGCDDGNDVDDDECSNACAPLTCGNGVVEGSEQCDDGNDVVADACLPNCAMASCGDGYIYAGTEECDDGVESAMCDSDCSLSSCGDGLANATAGEVCDDGNDVDTDDCPTTCQAAACGDGFLYAGSEACDSSEFGGEDCVTQGFNDGQIACDANCELDVSNCSNSACPGGGAFVNNRCWYASEVCESTQAKCQSVGLTGNDGNVATVWDAVTLTAVADGLGLVAGGPNGCCVEFGWIQNGTLYTHNYNNTQFYNWGGCFNNFPTLKSCNPP